MNTNLLTENIKNYTPAVKPEVDVNADLPFKKDYDINSWFAIGHFNADGDVIDFLYHLMIMKIKGINMMVSCFSVTNETTGFYDGTDEAFPLLRVKKDKNGFGYTTPTGHMRGDMDHMSLEAHMKSADVKLEMKAVSYPLYNCETGIFDFLGLHIHQYSIPAYDAKGTMRIDNKNYEVDGYVWFDRQWQVQGETFPGKWSWMDINLECGDRMSIWDGVAPDGTVKSWATILHEDGSLTVTDIETFEKTTFDHWKSEKSGNTYPGRWLVRIPAMDAELEVVPVIRDQEIAKMKGLAHYEGASTVKGTYKGAPASGYSYVELVGGWDK